MRSSVIALVLCAGGAAHVFDDPGQFFPNAVPHQSTLSAAAEGVYFTGAPRWSSLDCSSCHTEGPQKVTIKIGADDLSLFKNGYLPGQLYELEVSLGNETEGLLYADATCTEPPGKTDKYTYVQCNNNSFALEIDDDGGPLAGTPFCAEQPTAAGCPMPNPAGDEVVVAPDGDAVFANRQHSTTTPKTIPKNDPVSWHLWWTAPQAGTGPVTLYVAAVDGNGGSGTAASDQDPYGDDTVRATIAIQERGAIVPAGAQAGCGTIRGRIPPPLALLALLALALLLPQLLRALRRAAHYFRA